LLDMTASDDEQTTVQWFIHRNKLPIMYGFRGNDLMGLNYVESIGTLPSTCTKS
jgi:hypothetical protein